MTRDPDEGDTHDKGVDMMKMMVYGGDKREWNMLYTHKRIIVNPFPWYPIEVHSKKTL